MIQLLMFIDETAVVHYAYIEMSNLFNVAINPGGLLGKYPQEPLYFIAVVPSPGNRRQIAPPPVVRAQAKSSH